MKEKEPPDLTLKALAESEVMLREEAVAKDPAMTKLPPLRLRLVACES